MIGRVGSQPLSSCGNCGAPARWVEKAWKVKCTRPSCGVTGGSFERQSDAITAWENRSNPSPKEIIEALDEACALIQEAKGMAGFGSITDHLDFAESWLSKIHPNYVSLSEGETA